MQKKVELANSSLRGAILEDDSRFYDRRGRNQPPVRLQEQIQEVLTLGFIKQNGD
jgi:hypothetical protein